MNPIKRIEQTRSNRLTLGLHVDMQSRLYALVTKVSPEKILLKPEDISEWKKIIDLEQDVARAVSDSEMTDRLRKKNVERGKLITSLFSEIRSAMLSPLTNKSEAGRRLYPIVRAYRNLQRENMSEQTSHIDGLVVDLTKDEPQNDSVTIGVNLQINLLRQANDEFKRLRVERSHAMILENLPSSKTVRKQADEITASILIHIETAYIVATDADRKEISSLINEINQVIHETATTHKQGAIQRKNARDKKKDEDKNKGGGGNQKKPKDGDKDKTPKPGREEDPGEDKV